MKVTDMMTKLSDDIMLIGWVDSLRCCVRVRKKALPGIIEYIQNININDHDDNDVEAVTSMCAAFEA
eukprot:6723646-Ditylum_brightwellii.AAC.1